MIAGADELKSRGADTKRARSEDCKAGSIKTGSVTVNEDAEGAATGATVGGVAPGVITESAETGSVTGVTAVTVTTLEGVETGKGIPVGE